MVRTNNIYQQETNPVFLTEQTKQTKPFSLNAENPLVRSPKSDILNIEYLPPTAPKRKPFKSPKDFIQRAVAKLKRTFYKPSQSTLIKRIDNQYDALEKDLPKMQKLFQKTFLKEDISLEDTKRMLQEYREVEKLGVRVNKEEYITRLFDTVKKNFGFENANLKLELFEDAKSPTVGSASVTKNVIRMNKAKPSVFEVMHHEFRHIAQQFCGLNYNQEEYLNATAEQAYNTRLTYRISKNPYKQLLYTETAKFKSFDEWKKANNEIYGIDGTLLKRLKEKFNVKTFSKSNIPEKLHDFAIKSIEGERTYIDMMYNIKEYYKNFCEKDAYKAGKIITKFLARK